MLENMLSSNYVYYIMGIIFTVGIIIKAITGGTLNRLEKEAREMNKSVNPLLKLVKAKFEHSFMANGRVDNIEVFVDKFIREYKICGLSAHVWSRVKLFLVLLLVTVGVLASTRLYSVGDYNATTFEPGVVAMILAVLMLGTYYTVDEKYRLVTIKIYMMDHLENVMSKRLEKNYVKHAVSSNEMEIKAASSRKENAIAETTTEKFEIEDQKFSASTSGVTMEQVNEDLGIENNKLGITQLLNANKEDTENIVGFGDTIKLPEIEESFTAPIDINTEKKDETVNAAMLREILQEFMA